MFNKAIGGRTLISHRLFALTSMIVDPIVDNFRVALERPSRDHDKLPVQWSAVVTMVTTITFVKFKVVRLVSGTRDKSAC